MVPFSPLKLAVGVGLFLEAASIPNKLFNF